MLVLLQVGVTNGHGEIGLFLALKGKEIKFYGN